MIATIWALLSGTLGKVLAAIAVPLATFWAGHRVAAKSAENKTLKENVATRERIDHAKVVGDDPAAARRVLAERAKR